MSYDWNKNADLFDGFEPITQNSELRTRNHIEYSPSEFVEVFNQSIEVSFGFVHIEGELTNFRVSKGKWVYFDLKDEGASLKCFGTVYMLPGPLEDGMMVKLVCSPRLHPQFNFSLNVQSIVPSGQGALVKAAQLLRAKLEAEGLFDLARKRPLPYPPQRIALITSEESAAYADFTKIMRARWPQLEIDLFNVQVQGEAAPLQIVEAIEMCNKSAQIADALVVIRGGGSTDDLAAFSDERVVRVIAASRIPTMVAIGHEIDESLAELTADARASTPSNAAELLVPDRREALDQVELLKVQLGSSIKSMTSSARAAIKAEQERIKYLIEQLHASEKRDLLAVRQLLEAYNPTSVLKRGYALVKADGVVITRGKDLKKDIKINIQFSDITRRAKVID